MIVDLVASAPAVAAGSPHERPQEGPAGSGAATARSRAVRGDPAVGPAHGRRAGPADLTGERVVPTGHAGARSAQPARGALIVPTATSDLGGPTGPTGPSGAPSRRRTPGHRWTTA